MLHELEPISADDVSHEDLYPKGNPQNNYKGLYLKSNPQDMYPDLYPKGKPLVTRRAVLRKAPHILLGITALGLTAYDAYNGWQKEEPRQAPEPEKVVDPIIIPSLPEGYLEGFAIVDFTKPLELDTSSFDDRPFDLKKIDFFNRYRDVDVDRWIIIQNPFLDIRQEDKGNASRWITLIAYVDTTSQDLLKGGSYHGLYINLKPKDEQFADVPFFGISRALEASTPEQIAYFPDHKFVRSSDQKVIDGKTIGAISQDPKQFDDFLKKLLIPLK